MKSLLTLLFVVLAIASCNAASPKERAIATLQMMNLTEKLEMMHGHKSTYIGNIAGNTRLGIPAIHMQDGPQGFRVTNTTGDQGTTTAWPCALTVASAWDKSLARRWGAAMAEEFLGKGANMQLAPGIGIARVPTAGRNFEYLSGEDPYLGAGLVKEVVQGIQGAGVIANAKHWVNNEIEDERMLVSAEVDERTRYELYYPPFRAAVQAGVLSVMCAYNRINGEYACQNKETLSDLREKLGFTGWVVSDWTATHSTAPALLAGLDQEMPFGLHFSNLKLEAALANKSISVTDIDQSVGRMLTAMYSIGLFDTAQQGSPLANVTSLAHNSLARELAAAATVLLNNSASVLPVDIKSLSHSGCVAVLGDSDTISGGGSGHVTPYYIISPAQGVSNALAAAGLSEVTVLSADGLDLVQARQLAEKCELVIVSVATSSSEGRDRADLSLGAAQNKLVTEVLAVNARAIIAVSGPGAVLMPWHSSAATVLFRGLSGQEGGNALADVLFGAVNPSARLPVSMPNCENEVQFSAAQYPGTGQPPLATYSEQLLIGYRWYDQHQLTPVWSFGHGLSYTQFAYSQLTVVSSRSALTVTTTVTNAGAVAGCEVVQLYLGFPAPAGEPVKQLRDFVKTRALSAGQSEVVQFSLSEQDRSVWDPLLHKWALVTGVFTVQVGASSADLRLITSIEV